ncbi:thiamine-phosphate kinase [Sneathiella sp.]|uniref:thiamine-phosphate kinase n=1 Tax=Sneathiella sp. TaxID=1964365 RepID=UPI00260DCBDF|nr:thiamine-phosphate kinase [Sneathiella sp.]MDF2366472.1 thiamine-phosphate kinase [Sneathiella sp.]
MSNDTRDTGEGEFALIDRILKPLAADTPAALGLTDDAAVLTPSKGKDLVLTKDAMVAGVHFFDSDLPGDIARKLLRVNLSDLAAMGAAPVGYFLATFWPEDLPRSWIEDFADGLALDQVEFAIGLMGGDTVRTPGPLSLSLTAIGEVATDKALRRNGAEEGDLIVVSGTIGDGALGLLAAREELSDLDTTDEEYLIDRYQLPEPRLALGQALVGRATSCIDISDGLIADIGHLTEESGLGAVIDWEKVPLSDAAEAALQSGKNLIEAILTGGDDYELAFTLPSARRDDLVKLAKEGGVKLTIVGEMVAGEGVRVKREDGSDMPLTARGWQHF